MLLIGLKCHQAKLAHAPARHHAPCQLRGLDQIALSPGGHVAKNELLGSATRQHHCQPRQQLAAAVVVAVLPRQLLRDPLRPPVGYHLDLVHRVRRRGEPGHQRIARLVVGDHAPLTRILQWGPGSPEHDFILCLLKIRHGDLVPVVADFRERRFVAQVRQIHAVEADCAGDMYFHSLDGNS